MTKIQWTEQTWNSIVGCTITSPGCTNCYAMKIASRLGSMPNMPQYHGLTKKVNGNAVWTGKMNLVESVLLQPLKRKKPTMYFVNSMGDLFHESVPDEWIDRVFAVMALCPQHTFQVLTKRADRMRDYMRGNSFDRIVMEMMQLRESGGWPTINEQCKRHGIPHAKPASRDDWWPLPNVWLGVSVEDQTRADERIPLLLDTPAAVRFVSAEPLLGPVDLSAWVHNPVCRAFDPTQCTCDPDDVYAELDWVIVGGESGPKARPIHPDWARSLRDQCVEAGVPYFFKQWGEWLPIGQNGFNHWSAVTPRDRKGIWRGNARFNDSMGGPETNIIKNRPTKYVLTPKQSSGWQCCRVGTKAAGNLLDGKEWQQMPEGA
ncbi:MAG: phage Gp37/Gp68 family protein [Rhodobacteraceae bacterium]|nr:phage Gp37/Gp68 family protein [Paracoccaceae bacterium]